MDALLVKRAQRNDMDAFVALMEKHKIGLYKVAKSYLRSEEDVADVMQDTVLSAYEHIRELKNASYFKTWLTRILINHCKNLMRQQKRCIVSDEAAKTSETVPDDGILCAGRGTAGGLSYDLPFVLRRRVSYQ